MKAPSRQWSNCYFLVANLALRGRVRELVGVSTKAGLWPWHLVALTRGGHAMHLQAIRPHEENRLAPWWFLGEARGIPRRQLETELQTSGRRLCWRLRSRTGIALFLCVLYTLLVAPWVLAWGLWPLAYSASGVVEALKRRWRQQPSGPSPPPEPIPFPAPTATPRSPEDAGRRVAA